MEDVKQEDKKVDLLELQIEAVRAQAFAQGYTAGLQYVAKRAQGGANEQVKVGADKDVTEAPESK